jgi:hypothetical protein
VRQSAENIKIVDENQVGLFQRIILPRPGRKFVFDRTPGASYASEGEVYTCGYPADIHSGGGDIYLTNVERGSGCYDRISAWQYAKWHYV